MQKSPKVSVCIPVYNREDFIAEAIESVLSQTFTDFELIITDNCSTDKTPQIVQSYAQEDRRIIYFRNEHNLGICSSMNRALLLSRGEYIKFLFSDDKLAPECLEVFVEKMDKHPEVSLITSFTQSFGDSDNIRDQSYFPGTGQLDGKVCQKDLLVNGNWAGSQSSVMFRRRDLHIGVFNQMWKYWLGDLDMWLRLLGVGNAYIVPQVLSYLRIHEKQESSIHAVDFRLIKERLMLANIVFLFPHMYGEHTRSERRVIQNHLLKRLVREGIGKRGLKSKFTMVKIGLSRLSYSRIKFLLLLIKNLPRLFRKSRYNQ
jgi:glycosyltransferase involved in cell wall biosynthesis